MTGEKKERRKWRPWLLASLGAMLLILGAWWLTREGDNGQ